MLKYVLIFFLIFINNGVASNKEKIIENLNNIKNVDFNFEQNINGKIENGNCTLEYPKKIFCKYAKSNNKILVSNGKDFLIKKINVLEERIIDKSLINYTIKENDIEINVFFNKISYDLIGWQNKDLYQNFNITFLSSIRKNRIISENIFKLPTQN